MIDRHEPPTFHRRAPLPPRRRMNLAVSSEQLAALLNLPPDVTVAAFALDPLRDSVVFSLAGDRFDVVPEAQEARFLAADLDVITDLGDGGFTRRVTWEGLEGAEVATRHAPPVDPDLYHKRSTTVRARQWTGDEARILSLTPRPDFEKLTEPVGEDPDATASLLTAPHSEWVLLYDGDWVVSSAAGWVRMTDEEFVADYGRAAA